MAGMEVINVEAHNLWIGEGDQLSSSSSSQSSSSSSSQSSSSSSSQSSSSSSSQSSSSSSSQSSSSSSQSSSSSSQSSSSSSSAIPVGWHCYENGVTFERECFEDDAIITAVWNWISGPHVDYDACCLSCDCGLSSSSLSSSSQSSSSSSQSSSSSSSQSSSSSSVESGSGSGPKATFNLFDLDLTEEERKLTYKELIDKRINDFYADNPNIFDDKTDEEKENIILKLVGDGELFTDVAIGIAIREGLDTDQ